MHRQNQTLPKKMKIKLVAIGENSKKVLDYNQFWMDSISPNQNQWLATLKHHTTKINEFWLNPLIVNLWSYWSRWMNTYKSNLNKRHQVWVLNTCKWLLTNFWKQDEQIGSISIYHIWALTNLDWMSSIWDGIVVC